VAATAAVEKKKQRYRNSQKPDSHPVSGELLMSNCHFSPNTREVIRLHSALTASGGISGLVRTVMEYYLSNAINFDDPKYRGLEPVIAQERYRGQHEKLGLV
jgi:hypothetical protein